jgi:hypothetical protein
MRLLMSSTVLKSHAWFWRTISSCAGLRPGASLAKPSRKLELDGVLQGLLPPLRLEDFEDRRVNGLLQGLLARGGVEHSEYIILDGHIVLLITL